MWLLACPRRDVWQRHPGVDTLFEVLVGRSLFIVAVVFTVCSGGAPIHFCSRRKRLLLFPSKTRRDLAGYLVEHFRSELLREHDLREDLEIDGFPEPRAFATASLRFSEFTNFLTFLGLPFVPTASMEAMRSTIVTAAAISAVYSPPSAAATSLSPTDFWSHGSAMKRSASDSNRSNSSVSSPINAPTIRRVR